MQRVATSLWGPGPYYFADRLLTVGNPEALGPPDFAEDNEEGHVFRLDGGEVVLLWRDWIHAPGTYVLAAMVDDAARLLAEFVAESDHLGTRVGEA